MRCTKGIQFPQAFFTDCIWDETISEKRSKSQTKMKSCPRCFHFLIRLTLYQKGGSTIHSIHPKVVAPLTFLSSFLRTFILPKGERKGVKKQTTKGKSIENCYKFPQKVREQKKDKVNFLIGQRNKGSIKFCTCANIRQNKPFLRLPKNFQM